MFSFRKMVTSDKKRACEISLQAWEDDYIPQVFDDWVNEEKGEFTGVEYENQLIGYGKMSIFSDGEIWFEGLRKDLTHSAKGMAKALTKYYLEKVKKMSNVKSVRFATYFGNTASIKSNESMGFQKTHELSSKVCDIKMEEGGNSLQLEKVKKISDFVLIKDFLGRYEYFEKCGNFIVENWKVYSYSDILLKKYICNGECYAYFEDKKLNALCLIKPIESAKQLNIVAFAFETKGAGYELLKFLNQYMKQKEYNFMETIIPDIKDLKILLGEYGFYSWERENDFYIYEFPLNNLT